LLLLLAGGRLKTVWGGLGRSTGTDPGAICCEGLGRLEKRGPAAPNTVNPLLLPPFLNTDWMDRGSSGRGCCCCCCCWNPLLKLINEDPAELGLLKAVNWVGGNRAVEPPN